MDQNESTVEDRPTRHEVIEEIEVRGHIVDSLLLPKILDRILQMGGTFEILECTIGARRVDPSRALIAVRAKTHKDLDAIVGDLIEHGAWPIHSVDASTVKADVAGAFPEEFYSTTNQPTQVRIQGRWIDVANQEMDCGITIDPESGLPSCIPMADVPLGIPIVVGHDGVRVLPTGRETTESFFGFMGSSVSSEKPKAASLSAVAASIRATKAAGKKVLLVGGPAIVHTGSRDHVAELIRLGWIDVLFGGNALAAHDIEQSFFQTSLGVSLKEGKAIEHGHEHHLRAINRIRRVGGIRNAVDQGILESGIMYQAIRSGIEVVLAGSIRDDGPLPDVITDTIEAQHRMRAACRGVGFGLFIATALHGIATGNLLPAEVKVVCVDINPATVTKLSDRGTFQTVGMVTDVEPFLRHLLLELTGS